MKSYIDVCKVPLVDVGGKLVPKLILGCHPFDGESYVSREKDQEYRNVFLNIENTIEIHKYAILEAGIPVSQVDHGTPDLHRLHMSALTMIMEEAMVDIPVIPFVGLPLKIRAEKLDTKRMFATLDKYNLELGGEEYRTHFFNDPIVNYRSKSKDYIVTCETVNPYPNKELYDLEVDYLELAKYLGFFAGFNVLVLDLGIGDLLAMTDHLDLVESCLRELKREYGAVVLSVHHAGASIPCLEESNLCYDGYVTPVNRLGAAMYPTPSKALKAIGEATKPTIAIKALAGGRDLGEKSIRYALNAKGVIACMVGLGTLEETKETLQSAQKALDL